MTIKITGVSKIYGEQKALNNINLSISSGDIVGFLGPNGAGKSTLMKIITGFLPPTTGTVLINNTDIAENSLEIRKLIGYLPENNPLYLDMYVKEYLDFVAGIYKLKNRNEHIQQMIEKTGLSLEQKKKIGALSKGYRQRVGLAQAMIHDPQILILDEPTSGLDPNQIVEIRKLISDLGKEKTVLLSTHIMQEVEAICQRIIVINKGNIVAYEKTDTIKKQLGGKSNQVEVEFNQTINPKIFEEISEISAIKKLDDKKYLLETSGEIDIRQSVFDLAVKNSISVLSMQLKQKTLEQVFQELTK